MASSQAGSKSKPATASSSSDITRVVRTFHWRYPRLDFGWDGASSRFQETPPGIVEKVEHSRFESEAAHQVGDYDVHRFEKFDPAGIFKNADLPAGESRCV